MTADKQKKKTGTRRRSSEYYYHAMMLPGVVFLAIFSYIPMGGLVMAFQDYTTARGITGSDFVGLKHYRDLFASRDIWLLIRNTVVISLGKIFAGMLVAILFSILLNEIRIRWIKKSVQTVVYITHFISWVILASVMANLFSMDGVINSFLDVLGLAKLNFLGSNKLFQPLLIGTDVWKEYGYNSIIYLAAITSIDPGLYEAAAIDGASWRQRVWHVMIPGMLPIIILMTAVNLSHILSAGFDQIYNLYSPRVYASGDILDTYVYRVGMINRQYSFATAVGLFKSVIGLSLMLGVNSISKKAAHMSIF